MTGVDLKCLRIVFENVTVSDDLTLKTVNTPGDILFISIQNICQSYGSCANGLLQFESCEKLSLVLEPSCNTKWHEFVDKDFEPDSEYTLFERIQKCYDIVSIELFFNDGTTREIYVPWGDNEYINEFQHTIIDNNGMLHIVIDKEFKGFDFYNDAKI